MDTNFSPFPTLKTERLVLRCLELDDAEAIQKLRSDVRVNEFLDRPASKNLDEADEFILKIKNAIKKEESFYWVITHDSVQIGTICLWNLDFENDIAELGYELMPEAQGKGFMSEAIKMIIKFAFEMIQVKIITALPKAENIKSIRLLEKNNFVLDNAFKIANELDAEGYSVYYLSDSDNLQYFVNH